MPPTLLPQNAVQRIAAKLTQHNISNPILDKSSEQVRILETRVRTGTLGKSDHTETRAAVILEMVYRQETSARLPWKDLAVAVGVKPRSLEQFQQVIRNYLATAGNSTASRQSRPVSSIPASTIGTRSLLSSSRKRPLTTTTTASTVVATSQPARSNRVTRVDNIHDNSTTNRRLAELAIRLAVHLPDPHRACRAAQQLMQNMVEAVENHPSVHERRGLRYEFQRYQAAYEAAALYCVSRQTLQQQQRQDKSHAPTNDQEPALKSLDLHDLSDASTEFTYLELKQVLPHMIKTAETLKHKKKAPSASTTSQKFSDGRATSARVGQEPCFATESNGTMDAGDSAYARINDNEIDKVDTAFHQWQESVLAEACQDALASINSSTDKNSGDDGKSGVLGVRSNHHDPVLLAKAANDILIKYGVVSSRD